MARRRNMAVVADTASLHTIKKFELIEEYVRVWAQKLLNYEACKGIAFIDCMCNSGVYRDNNGMEVFGTPIRVANYLSGVMQHYPNKQAWLYFNDLSAEKIERLKIHLPACGDNLHITTRNGDGNELLKSIHLSSHLAVHYLLVYDPYTASLDWTALLPFLRNWGEVIINHMISDSIRGISQAKSDVAIAKYEQTYLASIEELATFGNDRTAYEQRIQEIIAALQEVSDKQYYSASFPFFNTRNGLVYNLIHCSGNIEGFKLFKKTAWKTFGGKSSLKDTHGQENQIMLDFDASGESETMTDEYCYYVKDIVKYVHNKFIGRTDVPLSEVWRALDEHPIFPSEGYRSAIKNGLKDTYGDKVSLQTITFTDRGL